MFRLIIACIFIMLPWSLHAYHSKSNTLSLEEAVLLALHNNPNVEQAQLNNVVQKFSLDLEQWQFKPHYFLKASRVTTRNYSITSGGMVTSNVTGVEPSVSYQTPFGTQLSLSSTNNMSNHYNPGLSFQIMQPLLRGFGRTIVQAALENAKDNEKNSRIAEEGALRDTVTAVINCYLDVSLAQNTLEVDQQALKRAESAVHETKLFIKGGKKAGVELVTVEADAASQKAQIENDQNALKQARYTLLTTIGIDPSTPLGLTKINTSKLIHKFTIPPLDQAKQLILENDTQYQIDKITLQGSVKRSLLLAEDNTRWQLNVTVNAYAGNGSGGGQNSGINSLVNGVNQTNSVTVDLTIPIDDRAAKTALSIEKVAVRQAEIALKEEQWSNEAKVINAWNSVHSEKRALVLAENSAGLQEKSFNINFQKYSHGLIDSLALQTAQQQLNLTQRLLVNARINYLKAMTNLDSLVGKTLSTWNIQSSHSRTAHEKV